MFDCIRRKLPYWFPRWFPIRVSSLDVFATVFRGLQCLTVNVEAYVETTTTSEVSGELVTPPLMTFCSYAVRAIADIPDGRRIQWEEVTGTVVVYCGVRGDEASRELDRRESVALSNRTRAQSAGQELRQLLPKVPIIITDNTGTEPIVLSPSS